MRQNQDAFRAVLRRCALGMWLCGVAVQCGQPAEQQVARRAITIAPTPGSAPDVALGVTSAPASPAPSVSRVAAAAHPREATSPPPTPEPAGHCDSEGWLQCVSAAQPDRRICRGGVWTRGETCSVGENCDQAIGTCLAIVAGCQGRSPGYRFCDEGGAANLCGVDLTRVDTRPCPNGCVEGRCIDEGEGSTGPECPSSMDTNGGSPSCSAGETPPRPITTEPVALSSSGGVLSEAPLTDGGMVDEPSQPEESEEPVTVW